MSNVQPARLFTLRDARQVTVRAALASDAAEIVQAFDRLSADSKYARFMAHKNQINPASLERGLNPVPGQSFVFVATVPASDGFDIVGAAQYVRANQNDDRVCEFAISVAEGWRGSGLAVHLMVSLIRRSRRDGYRTMEGLVLAVNRPMLALARKLRFKVAQVTGDAAVMRVERQLVGAERPLRTRIAREARQPRAPATPGETSSDTASDNALKVDAPAVHLGEDHPIGDESPPRPPDASHVGRER